MELDCSKYIVILILRFQNIYPCDFEQDTYEIY